MAYEDLGEPRSRVEGYLDNLAGGDNDMGRPRSRIEAYLERVAEGAGGSVPTSDVGAPGGVASLDASGKVPASQLPSYVDDVVEAASYAALPATGEAGKIYVTIDDGKCWRWGGSAYAEVASGGVTYALSRSGTTLTLTGSDGSTSEVTDADTIYEAATATTAGLMSAADKAKLDAMPPVEVVSELPASPDAGTVYIVTEAS